MPNLVKSVDRARDEANREAVARHLAIGGLRHDDALILTLAANGWMWWTIATEIGLSDEYVRSTIRHEGAPR